MKKLNAIYKDWEKNIYEPFIKKTNTTNTKFISISEEEIKSLYTPLDLENFDSLKELGYPGQFPYTRGIHSTMYRGRHWTMRQFSGFGNAHDTNKRFKYLLAHGQTGLSVAFHMPTIMGYDSDNPKSVGEVGKCGVSIDTLRDMEILFDGIHLDEITTSMTINAPASVLLAMYIVVGEKQGVKREKLGGTIQNDILKEYIAQKSWIFPPKPSIRLITDTIRFCSKEVPKWNTISISGYHIREAGSTAIQELAFTLADGIAYVEACINTGLDVDIFAPRLSFFFNAHNDLFEEIAKYRAARRMWANIMKNRFNAKKEESMKLRFHTQTAGCSLQATQPMNNIIRTTIQALAAVLGGTQSLHTNSLDETLALPTEEAATIALRTQQIIAEESFITHSIDPVGGSYYVETLTNNLEKKAYDYINKIDKMGGMLEAIKAHYPQREIQNAAFNYQKKIESKENIIVGVNKYQTKEENPIPILYIDPKKEKEQIKSLRALKKSRANKEVTRTLKNLDTKAKTDANLMPYIIEAVKSYASIEEICNVFRHIFGEYKDPAIF
jgi:methylmalonyl-CoA mutase N-terminal domain/subunit